ncbi:hypothetical protein GCM10027563_11290 [Parasphingorhabdus pacifica]
MDDQTTVWSSTLLFVFEALNDTTPTPGRHSQHSQAPARPDRPGAPSQARPSQARSVCVFAAGSPRGLTPQPRPGANPDRTARGRYGRAAAGCGIAGSDLDGGSAEPLDARIPMRNGLYPT